SYTTYSLPFTLMNTFIPLVTSLTQQQVFKMNTFLLLLDMCALPLFGYLATRISKEKIMITAAIFTFFSSLPFLYSFSCASATALLVMRTCFVLCGVAFSATYYSWIHHLVEPY